jgi:aminoglycoside phosphotransferase (APT) family kinase protein
VSAVRMHEDELLFDETLVRRLLAAQFPQWAGRSLARVPSDGTDNALYRLGDELVVRLPRVKGAVGAREKEHHWLPRLAPHLSVEIPEPVALGEPCDDYPWPWSVYRWLEGERPAAGGFGDLDGLVSFLRALRAVDPSGAPAARRGCGLPGGDDVFEARLGEVADEVDADAARAVWKTASAAPGWDGPPVWVHGDLMPGNVLVRGGRLAGVIDWGLLGVGDPACDLLVAWTLLDADQRAVFRAAFEVDEASWQRGRGWALVTALNAIPYYRHTNPGLVANARYRLEQLLKEVGA